MNGGSAWAVEKFGSTQANALDQPLFFWEGCDQSVESNSENVLRCCQPAGSRFVYINEVRVKKMYSVCLERLSRFGTDLNILWFRAETKTTVESTRAKRPTTSIERQGKRGGSTRRAFGINAAFTLN
jgi:hypothetical protein